MRHKLILVTLAILLSATTGDAAWFGNDDQLNKVQKELHEQRQDTAAWMTVAGVLGVDCTILFGIGAAIGAKARKEVKKDE